MATVLVVDDDPVSRLLARRLLTNEGHDVVEAADAAEAMAILRAGLSFDLIVSDECMPNMTGRELRQALGTTLQSRFLLLTGTVISDVDDATFPSDAHLTKPVSSSTLAATVSRLLAGDLDHPTTDDVG